MYVTKVFGRSVSFATSIQRKHLFVERDIFVTLQEKNLTSNPTDSLQLFGQNFNRQRISDQWIALFGSCA